MIRVEAVEAAAKGAFARTHPHGNWSLAIREMRDQYLAESAAALEAAAPYMLADTMRAVAAEIGGNPATAVTDPAVHRLLKMLLDRADKMESTDAV